MLAGIVISLQPNQPTPIPPHAGRSLHAVFLNLIAHVDANLAAHLHSPMPIKPFTVSPLLGKFERVDGRHMALPERTYTVRYTVLTDDVFHALTHALLEHQSERKAILLNEYPFLIRSVHLSPKGTGGWANLSSYERLWEESKPSSHLRLHFRTPTAFKVGDIHHLFPEPYSVFGSLYRTWRAFSSIPLPEGLLQVVDEQVVVVRYQLATRLLNAGSHVLVGFVGRCEYEVREARPLYRRSLSVLADYALYAGVGMKRTQGMGQARRLRTATQAEGKRPHVGVEFLLSSNP